MLNGLFLPVWQTQPSLHPLSRSTSATTNSAPRGTREAQTQNYHHMTFQTCFRWASVIRSHCSDCRPTKNLRMTWGCTFPHTIANMNPLHVQFHSDHLYQQTCAWITSPAACLWLRGKKKKKSAITLSFGSIFFQLLLPFVFGSSSLFSSLPAYDLCAGCGPGTFSAALACGYFRSVAFQVVRSTLPVSDVVRLIKGTRSSHHKPGQTHSARSHLLIVGLLCFLFFLIVLLADFWRL